VTSDYLDNEDLYFLPKLLRVDGYSLYIENGGDLKVEEISFTDTSIVLKVRSGSGNYLMDAEKILDSDAVFFASDGEPVRPEDAREIGVRAEDGSTKFFLRLRVNSKQSKPSLKKIFNRD
jgi:hypothetical protein